MTKHTVDKRAVPQSFPHEDNVHARYKHLLRRPSSFTWEVGAIILQRLASGENLMDILRKPTTELPEPPDYVTVMAWVRGNLGAATGEEGMGFADLYKVAQEMRLERMSEEILSIADTPVELETKEVGPDGAIKKVVISDSVPHRNARIESRKWILSKLVEKFGNKTTTELTGAGGGPVAVAGIDLRGLSGEELEVFQQLLSKATNSKEQE